MSTETAYWEEDIETLPREALEKLQLKKVREMLEQAQLVPFYREKFEASAIDPGAIRNLDCMKSLPFTAKDDLRKQWPYGLLAVPRHECVRAHTSSGSTGRAVAVFHTQKDVDTWSNLVARCLYGVGVRRGDIFQNMAGYGLFTGGLGFHYGAQKLGTLTIPIGAGNSRRQVNLIRDFGTTVIHIMPSFAIYLMKVFEDMGIDPERDTKLRTLFLGAEPHSEETRRRIETFYGVDAYNSYGLSEMNGPGVSFECHRKEGLHIWEDNYVVEIIDPEGDEPVSPGEVGELVYTTLQREAMPLIRYRSRDLASFIQEPCDCGRTHRRISRIQGRVDDMFIWKGVNIYPLEIEKVLMEFKELQATYLVVLETKNGVDRMTVQVEAAKEFLEGQTSVELQAQIGDSLRAELFARPEAQLVSSGSIPLPEVGKAKRVVDKRSL